eukprot:scaffold69631_cov21-Phaeocystis_antarctica.AAC.1
MPPTAEAGLHRRRKRRTLVPASPVARAPCPGSVAAAPPRSRAALARASFTTGGVEEAPGSCSCGT